MLTHTGTTEIRTERLILRRFEHSDVDDMLNYWISDPQIQSLYCEPVYTSKPEVQALLDKYISSYEKCDYYRWAVILKETSECIGQIAFFLMDSTNHFAEIEYCIGSKFQRKGFATEAARAVVRFGFKQIHLHKIQISHKSNNTPSKKVIENCGFIYEGTLRDYFHEGGHYTDRVFYSLLEKEYQG